MSKVADYYITGVWKDTQGRITDVMLHLVIDNNSFSDNGVKTSKNDVIKLLKSGNLIKTVIWDYPGWSLGAYVTYETVKNEEYLRTEPNSAKRDNLDNSFPF